MIFSASVTAAYSGGFNPQKLKIVPSVKRSTIGSRAFPVASPKTWNALPEDVTSSQSEYTFRRQLKTCLFKKSFPDIII